MAEKAFQEWGWVSQHPHSARTCRVSARCSAIACPPCSSSSSPRHCWLACGGGWVNPAVAGVTGRERAFQGVQPCTPRGRGLRGGPCALSGAGGGVGTGPRTPTIPLHRNWVHRGDCVSGICRAWEDLLPVTAWPHALQHPWCGMCSIPPRRARAAPAPSCCSSTGSPGSPQPRQRHNAGAEIPLQRPARLPISVGGSSLQCPGPPGAAASHAASGMLAGASRILGHVGFVWPELRSRTRQPGLLPASPRRLGGAGAALRGAGSHHHLHRQSSPPPAKRPLCLPPPSPASRFLKKGFCPVDHIDQHFPPAPFTVSLPPCPLGEAPGAAQSRGCLPSSPASQHRRWKPLRCSRFCFEQSG